MTRRMCSQGRGKIQSKQAGCRVLQKRQQETGQFIDNESGFHTAEEKVWEGTRYWKPRGDERFSAVRIRWDKIMGMLVENRRNLSPKNKIL